MTSPKRTRKGSLQPDQVSELRLLINETKKEIIDVLREDLKSVKQRLETLNSRFSTLEESVLSIQQKHEKLEAEISEVKSEMYHITEKSCRQTLSEMESRLLRMNNVIIRGLPEEDGTVEERADKDRETVQALFAELEVEQVTVTDVRRLGRPNKSKSRLLRASLPNPAKKQEILRKAKFLKNSSFKNVYVQADLTPAQQDIERDLRRRLKDRREQGEDVVIYAGEIRPRLGLKGFRR